MAYNSLRKASLESMEAEIESLLKTLEHLKHDASEESQKSMKAIRSNAENALRQSRTLMGEAYEEVKARTRQTGIATRDYAQNIPDHRRRRHRCPRPAGRLADVQAQLSRLKVQLVAQPLRQLLGAPVRGASRHP